MRRKASVLQRVSMPVYTTMMLTSESISEQREREARLKALFSTAATKTHQQVRAAQDTRDGGHIIGRP